MAIRRRGGARWILAVLACAAALFFLFPQTRDRPLSLIEVPFVWTVSQITGMADGVTRTVAEIWDEYVSLRSVRLENELLKMERERLVAELSRSEEDVLRAARLSDLLELKPVKPFQTTVARVIGGDATRWFDSLLVDRGSVDHVSPGDGVITPRGVVGRVVSVTHDTAQVLAVHNRASVVPARIQRSRYAGILVGSARSLARQALSAQDLEGAPNPETLSELKYMYRSADVVVGDEVVTSGLAGRFPPGVPIGTVVHVKREKTETFLHVYVAPKVTLETLEEVEIVRGGEPVSPEAGAE